jgi:hypothetical protein
MPMLHLFSHTLLKDEADRRFRELVQRVGNAPNFENKQGQRPQKRINVEGLNLRKGGGHASHPGSRREFQPRCWKFSRNTEHGSRRFPSVTFFVIHGCYLPPASPCEFFLDGDISALIRCGTRKSPLRILCTSCQKD